MPWFEKANESGMYLMPRSPTKRVIKLDPCQLECVMMLDAAADSSGKAELVYGQRHVLKNGKVQYMLRAWKDVMVPQSLPPQWVKVYEF